MNKTISPKITALTFGILAICFLAAFYVVAWQEPGSVPPAGNVATPLNVSNVGQIKTGNLVVNALGTSATSGNALIVNSGGNLCLGTDCRSAWPAGGGVITTYRMEASSYRVGNNYYSKTVSYNCPAGSSVVNVVCSSNKVQVGAGSGNQCSPGCQANPNYYSLNDSCSCSYVANTATLKASVQQIKQASSASCDPLWCFPEKTLTDFCYPHREDTYPPFYWSTYSCYIPSGTPQCAVEFQCGIKQTVGQ